MRVGRHRPLFRCLIVGSPSSVFGPLTCVWSVSSFLENSEFVRRTQIVETLLESCSNISHQAGIDLRGLEEAKSEMANLIDRRTLRRFADARSGDEFSFCRTRDPHVSAYEVNSNGQSVFLGSIPASDSYCLKSIRTSTTKAGIQIAMSCAFSGEWLWEVDRATLTLVSMEHRRKDPDSLLQ